MSNVTALSTIKPTTPAAKPSALNLMASRLSCDPAKLLTTLKATVFKGANDEEVMALCLVANEYGLNPLLKEMYAFPAKGGGIVPVVSVDGWNKMLLRQPSYDGKKFTFERGEDGRLISCTATIFVKGRDHAEEITEYFDECQRNTDNWKNMPHRMLRNRTLCQASRMAFGFSGVYHEEEAQTIIEVSEPANAVRIANAKPAVSDEPPMDGPTPMATVKDGAATPQEQLAAAVVDAGFNYTDFAKWAIESGNMPDADSFSEFGEVNATIAKRLLRSTAGMVKGIAEVKGIKV